MKKLFVLLIAAQAFFVATAHADFLIIRSKRSFYVGTSTLTAERLAETDLMRVANASCRRVGYIIAPSTLVYYVAPVRLGNWVKYDGKIDCRSIN